MIIHRLDISFMSISIEVLDAILVTAETLDNNKVTIDKSIIYKYGETDQ